MTYPPPPVPPLLNVYQSPCIRICCIDPESGFCLGCRRTVEEIKAWGRANPDQRAEILRNAAARGVPRCFG